MNDEIKLSKSEALYLLKTMGRIEGYLYGIKERNQFISIGLDSVSELLEKKLEEMSLDSVSELLEKKLEEMSLDSVSELLEKKLQQAK